MNKDKISNYFLKIFRINDWTIMSKYMASLFFVILLFFVSFTIILTLLLDIKAENNKVKEIGNELITISKMESLMMQKKTIVINYINDFNEQNSSGENYNNRQANLLEFNKIKTEYDGLKDKLNREVNNEKLKRLFNTIQEYDENFNEVFLKKIVPLFKENSKLNSWSVNSNLSKGFENANQNIFLLETAKEILIEDREVIAKGSKEKIKMTIITLISAIIISSVLGFVLILIISTRIKNNLKKVIKVSNEIAKGNLAVEKLNYKGKDEIGLLAKSINMMIDNLKEVIYKTLNASNNTLVTTEEISAATEENSASIEDVADVVKDFVLTSNKLAKVSTDISNLIDKSVELVGTGFQEIQDTEGKMNKIINSSQKSTSRMVELNAETEEVVKIVEVISEIAEQTNLLALNASIEAARANFITEGSSGTRRGKHGSGFAVVADEIRGLAARTKNSVGDIRSIIDRVTANTDNVVTSIQKNNLEVEAGAQSLVQAKETFNKIDSKIKLIANQIREVANLGKEIYSKSAGVSVMTEEQSATIQQISTSMDELSVMASNLNNIVERFNLD
ncbi:methyl-accepting chemotaxis protein [Orenia metallireducens]|jgi:methyl-accepting chemotaxis protein|uniref:Methyl-accepting chemotaxis protein n=1 Tax=Orenia metallireducens TaxID=1413210 RepID=A0A285H4I9_9FIRM|nr:methyl-accepting chemotaxis protein [Orenia metallireducens]PRX28592.1 methyl-accepting chemotaxis protein [Orenia metallireducens]SNY30638.1 Methyl-accepting chemotaxis protein [Orenia metallireducens]